MDTTNILNKTVSAVDLVDRIEQVLSYKCYSKKQLADACGFHFQNLARWKARGMLPDLEVGVRIADFLNVPLYWLLTGRNERGEIPVEDYQLLEEYHALNDGDREVVDATIKALLKRYVRAGFEGHLEVD